MDATEDKLFAVLLGKVKRYHPSEDIEVIRNAYTIAKTAHEGQKRKSGEPYIIHPLNAAIILAEMRADKETIAAGLLHDILEDTSISSKALMATFGDEILFLVEGVTKLEQFSTTLPREELQADNLKKLLLAMSDDIRVILIKLADRLHNMRTLQYQSPEKQKRIAQETLDVYAPIAARLGIFVIQSQLEDLSLNYLEPQRYQEIEAKLSSDKMLHREEFHALLDQIHSELLKFQIKSTVTPMQQHIFGIHRKIVNAKQKVEEFQDTLAIKIVVADQVRCYETIGVLHKLFTAVPGKFKDFIGTPKSNFYSALQTNVITETGLSVKLRIMTEEMSAVNEYGILYYLKYKGDPGAAGSPLKEKQKFEWLKEILEWQREGDNPKFMQLLKNDFNLYNEKIYCFTPKGKVLELPRGATAIDFAYQIHSDVGNSMAGARIDGKKVAPATELQKGNIVEIITEKERSGPHFNWLSKVKTSKAKSSISQWYRGRCDEATMKRGETIFKQLCADYGFRWKSAERIKAELIKKYNVNDWRLILLAISTGEIDLETAMKEIDIVKLLADERIYTIKMATSNRLGLLSEVAEILKSKQVDIKSLNLNVNAEKSASIAMTISIPRTVSAAKLGIKEALQALCQEPVELSEYRP